MFSKIARTITSVLPVDDGRIGSCNNCGECCKLPFRCTFLREDVNGKYVCAAYKLRPLNCRKFPRSRQQWQSVKTSCGYSFEE